MLSDIKNRIVHHLTQTQETVDHTKFSPIPAYEFGGRIAAIDGGQAELVASPSLLLGFVRVIGYITKQENRLKTLQAELSVLCLPAPGGVTVEIFGSPLLSSFFFPTKSDSPLPLALESARRMAEYRIARECAKEMNGGDVVVLDGSLDPKAQHEIVALHQLEEEAIAKGTLLCGLSKTSELVNSEGQSIMGLLSCTAPGGRWSYPLEMHKYCVRLHPRSEYVFRLDTKNLAVLPALVGNATDYVFPGYPWALVWCDQLARVSDGEKQYLAQKMRLVLGENWNTLMNHARATSAHEVLDGIQF